MTASLLLALICAALILQLSIAIGVAFWRYQRRGGKLVLPGLAKTQPAVQPPAWTGWRQFRVQRRTFEDPGLSQCSFDLVPVDGMPLPPFRPGQFLTVSLEVAGPGSLASGPTRPVTRCYSLSERPEPAGYRITVKRVPAPADRPELPEGVASNHLHDRVREGDMLSLKAPAGDFYLDPDPLMPVVLVAGGIGITPMMSMLGWCLGSQPDRPVHLYYGVRNGEELAFGPQLMELARAHPGFHLNLVYSRPRAADTPGIDFSFAGHIDIDLLRSSLPPGKHQFYVCGPPAMMESLVPALTASGVLPEDLHFEAFGPATARRMPPGSVIAQGQTGGPAWTVRFLRSGRTLTWDGQDNSLLDFAERHGVSVEAGCRSGRCGCCETRLVSGSTRCSTPAVLVPAAGYCLLCVCTPTSPLVLEA